MFITKKENKMKKNVYIATLPRSGSTLLGMMLNQHSRCFNMGESFFWKKFVPQKVRCSCGDTNCFLLNMVFDKISNVSEIMNFFGTCQELDKLPENRGEVVLSEDLKQRIEESCVGLNILSSVFRELTLKDIIIDTSTNIRIARGLISEKDWKIVLLTRDPRGVLYSYKKANDRHQCPGPLGRKINIFKDFAKNALYLISKSDVIFVKYEDLCRFPEKELKRISLFLGISFEKSMLDFKKDTGHTVMGNRMRFDNNNMKIKEDLSWISGLTKNEKELLTNNNELTALWEKLGYRLK